MSTIIRISQLSLLDLVGHLTVRRVQIISSCTLSKSIDSEDELSWEDFEKGGQWLDEREGSLNKVAAHELYTGRQHQSVVDMIQSNPQVSFDLKIVSAAYGLIEANHLVAPYNATFSGLPAAEIARRAILLGLPQAFREAVEQTDADLTLILLGKSYLDACAIDHPMFPPCPTIVLGNGLGDRGLKGCNLFQVGINQEDCSRLGAGQVWVKAEVAREIIRGAGA